MARAYEKARRHVTERREAGLSERELEFFEVIELDVQRSDRLYWAFDGESANFEALEHCLEAWVLANPQYGYAQGMNGERCPTVRWRSSAEPPSPVVAVRRDWRLRKGHVALPRGHRPKCAASALLMLTRVFWLSGCRSAGANNVHDERCSESLRLLLSPYDPFCDPV